MQAVMKKQNVRTLSLIVVTFTYLLMGAAIFDSLESENEIREFENLTMIERGFMDKYNITQADWDAISPNIIKFLPHKAGTQWKFSGAFFFSTTVITTIGYGYSTPKTSGGKVFCMFYALLGIPLNLIMFQSIGERLNIFVTFLLRHMKRCLRFKSIEVSQTNLIFVCMNMSSIVVVGGAWVFSQIEEWSYLDAFYYCVITLTTIGFGDYVVLQRKDLQKRPEYIVFSLIFILFGLAVLSAAMNLLVLRFLTMNTEDERKDELEAITASRTAVRLEGDIITSSSGALLQNQQQPAETTTEYHDRTSVCSCTCYNFRSNYFRRSKKQSYSLAHGGGSIIAQLMQPVRVLQAMTQVHAKRDSEWFMQNTVFGQRRNSI